ncbi:MAG: hypothetical protein K8T91_02485 [Planctomycetes bacterium]|nr:hypothetical protein [Planctomycetota bacterium]
MPLFQLPFHLRNVDQGLIAGLSLGFVFLTLTILADCEVWPFRLLVDLFMTWRMGAINATKRFAVFKKIMYLLACVVLMIAFFYGLVLVGVIANGTPPAAPTIEEFMRSQRQKGH